MVEKWCCGFNRGWKRRRFNAFNFCKPQKRCECAIMEDCYSD